MNNNVKNTGVPPLRFAEFKNTEGWVIEPLGEVYSFKVTNSFSRENLNYEKGEVKNIHYGDIHTKFSTLFDIKNEKVPFINTSISIEKIRDECYCMEGDMIFADASEDLNDIGKSIEIVNLNNEKLLSGLHTLLARQKTSKLEVGFGGYLFTSNWIRTQIQKESQGTKVLSISTRRLSNIDVYYPKTKKEQQKIASCLTSLDALITAQSDKLAALKAHKKGLMQQLFPAEGETVPQLRFAEFKDTEGWETHTLKNLVSILSGYPFQSEYFSDKGKKLLTPKNFTKSGYAKFDNQSTKFTTESCDSKYICKEGDLMLLLTDLTPSCELLGKPILFTKGDGEALLNQRIIKIIPNNNLEVLFLLYFFLTENYHKRIKDTATGSTVRHSSNKIIEETEICLPSLKEQQKIADCLSSLDALITAASDKLEGLKVHKKGLMQQLFPTTQDDIAE